MDTLALRRLDRLIWMTIALVATIVLAATAVGDFRIEWRTFAAPGLGCLALALACWFYRRWRSDLRLASALNATAQMIAFAAVGAPLSYLAASANLPLQDHAFDAIDRALGLDWRGLLSWMNSQSALHPLFMLPYLSFTVQASITVLALAFSNRLLQLRTFMLAFMLSAIVCIAISAVVPAEGVWGFYGLTPADYPAIVPATRELHLPIFHGLRDGSLRTFAGMTSEGIITFPSFHAALSCHFHDGAVAGSGIALDRRGRERADDHLHADRRRPLLHRRFSGHRHRGALPDRRAPHHGSGPTTERAASRRHGSPLRRRRMTSDDTCRVRA